MTISLLAGVSRLGGLLAGASVVVGGVSFLFGHLAINATSSLPKGFYAVTHPTSLARGDLVAVPVPASVRGLVKERAYLFRGADLYKHIVAMPGDDVCVTADRFVAAGQLVGAVSPKDSAGRPLPVHRFCGRVPDGSLYVASSAPRSFDSRYFGPVASASVKGVLRPLWTF